MRRNSLRQFKVEGRTIVNGWLAVGSSYSAEIVANQGFDSVTVDCQHGMMDFGTTLTMLQAISTTNAIPLVRPSRMCGAEIMRYLDAGAYGVICPMISNRADAELLVASCRYPPAGCRSFGPARGLLYGGMDYAVHANDEILVLAMIETSEALDNLGEIVSTPGLDGVYIGPNDLALNLGRQPANESNDPVVVSAVERIRRTASEKGLITGIFCSGGKEAAARGKEGFDLVTPGNDANMLRSASREAVRLARELS